jgi:hypothetical protein
MGKGTLLKETPAFVIAGSVEAETLVPWALLRENEDFVKMIRKADTIKEVTSWVEENH